MKLKAKEKVVHLVTSGEIFKYKSLNDIAKELCVSREWIRQVMNELNCSHFSRNEKMERNATDPEVLFFLQDLQKRLGKNLNEIAKDLEITYNTLFYAATKGKLSKSLKSKFLQFYDEELTKEEKKKLL